MNDVLTSSSMNDAFLTLATPILSIIYHVTGMETKPEKRSNTTFGEGVYSCISRWYLLDCLEEGAGSHSLSL